MPIAPITDTAQTASAAPSPKPVGPSFDGEEFNQFLTLLTTQVENQDPMKPMDSTAFVEQLATFSSLEQQVHGNDLLEKILAAVDGA